MNAHERSPQLAQCRWPGPVIGTRWQNRTRLNARRVRDGWGSFLERVEWNMSATLTVDPRKADVSENMVSREVFAWCGDVGRLSRRPVGWAYVVEAGGGGRLHAHALLIGADDGCWRVAEGMWAARNGMHKLTPVFDVRGAVDYMCKAIGVNGEIVLADTIGRYRKPQAGNL